MADVRDEVVSAGVDALVASHGLSHQETVKKVYAAMKLADEQPAPASAAGATGATGATGAPGP